MRYELFIAIRQIRARKFQTLLSVGAIALAVMVLTVFQALMIGFTGELYNTTVNKLPHVSVSPQEGEDYIYLYTVLHQLDQKIIYLHYDFKHLTEKYFEIGMKLRNS
jgi:lipoprotein-releasing system permease protein